MNQIIKSRVDNIKDSQHGFIVAGIINFIFGVMILLLSLRFVFKLLAANPLNGLVDFVYDFSAPLVQPFVGIFGQADAAGRFELATLIAIIVYGLIAAVLNGLFSMGRRHTV